MENGVHRSKLSGTSLRICRFPAIVFFLFVMPAFISGQANAQQVYSYNFAGESLAEALERIASDTETDLIFDPKIIGDQYIYKRLRGSSVQELLKSLLSGKDLDYIILSSGTFVILSSVAEKPGFGSLSGVVTDVETGETLPGATIMYADASAGTVTNRSGQFNLSKLISGDHEFIISFVGYEPVKLSINITEDSNSRERIGLQPRPVDVSPVVISAHRRTVSGHNHNEFQNPESTMLSAGRHHCAIRSLSLFSGVQHGIPLTDTHIQGGQRGEHRMYLDGVPVYNPYSFGRLFSAFRPFAINRVEVEKAGFDASSGSHIAGKIDLSHLNGSPGRPAAVLQADPLSTNIFGSGGFQTDQGRRATIMGAYRTSVWDIYQNRTLSGVLQDWDTIDPLVYNLLLQEKTGAGIGNFRSVGNDSDIRFSDLHLSGTYQHSPYQRFHTSFYRGSNSVMTDVLAREQLHGEGDYMFSRDSYEWTNSAGQISYDWIATPRLDLGLQLAYSSNRLGHAYTMLSDDIIDQFMSDEPDESKLFNELGNQLAHGATQHDENTLEHFISKVDAEYAFSPGFALEAGLQADRVISRFNLSNLFYLPVLDTQRSTILSSYLNGKWVFAGPIQLKIGSRFTYLTDSETVYAEPRVQLQYDRQQSAIGFWSVRLSGGMYRQFINQFDITNAGPSSIVPSFSIWAHDSNLRQPKAYHGSLSFLSEPGPSTQIRLEGWTRLQPSAYITSYERLLLGDPEISQGFDSFAEITDIQSFGSGIRVEQSLLDSRLQLLAGYDYTYTSVNMESQFDRRMPASWTHPHTFMARVTARIDQNWMVAGKWQHIAGRTWAYRQSYYDFLMMHNVHSVDRFDFTSPENDRLPSIDQVDISLIYTRQTRITEIQARIDLMNVLNRRNVIDRTVHATAVHDDGSLDFGVRDRTLPGFNPSISLQFSF